MSIRPSVRPRPTGLALARDLIYFETFDGDGTGWDGMSEGGACVHSRVSERKL